MTTIPIEAEVSTEQLLRAVMRLPSQEFAAFVNQLLALRAQRQGPHLNQEETTLLRQINEGISVEAQRRIDELVAKRQAETITPEELAELSRITEQIEHRDAQRLAALDALAHLRLGITPPPDA
jgi:iron-sulfur cluster repair protein YtfE (RIC family)